METNDLRDWLAEVEKMGELQRVDEADWDLEVGALTALNGHRPNGPALLFDNIAGYPRGYRVLSGSTATRTRLELTFNLPPNSSNAELVQTWREKMADWESRLDEYPYEEVDSGPILENVHSGKDINLFEFPVPRWHELDGGRYIGTGDAVITRDPDTGEVNLGTYRIMIQDEKTTALYISPGKHGRIHYEKWHAQGKPCPVAISVGHHPLIFRVAGTEVPAGSEYSYMGAVNGKPIKIIKEEITGLPIPADSEIVIAGFCPPGKTRMEGPFGEWTGYYASKEREAPILEVERVYHRNDPILLGHPPHRPPNEGTLFNTSKAAALLHNALERSSVPDVRGVWVSEVGVQQLIVVSIKQRYPGHARQAGFLASQNRPAAYHGRYVIVVDEDIDPNDIQQVLWALCTRSDPATDIDIIRRAWSTPLDTMIRKPADGCFNSRAIIDACKPYEWIDEFPKEVTISPELTEKMRNKWGDLLKL